MCYTVKGTQSLNSTVSLERLWRCSSGHKRLDMNNPYFVGNFLNMWNQTSLTYEYSTNFDSELSATYGEVVQRLTRLEVYLTLDIILKHWPLYFGKIFCMTSHIFVNQTLDDGNEWSKQRESQTYHMLAMKSNWV